MALATELRVGLLTQLHIILSSLVICFFTLSLRLNTVNPENIKVYISLKGKDLIVTMLTDTKQPAEMLAAWK